MANVRLKLLDELVSYLKNIPGIGEKNALKYAFWLAEHKDKARAISTLLNEISTSVKPCKLCYNLTINEDGICDICADSSRNRGLVCVVESIENILEIELANVYNGLYFILGGVISPIYGIDSIIKRIDHLAQRIIEEHIEEVILLISPTTEGELTIQYIKEKLKQSSIKITKVAIGVPAGADINYINRKTLIEAFKMRTVA
ncbi:recombination mediator RecR [Hippea sp. KM1]|uniref:recombination mediator RecR n=1 Tax=Hippea sp. KM1 TaxID=944481 RepID=UPI0004A809EB|nr:recombination mediator RecR [Hippea sp. KM1]